MASVAAPAFAAFTGLASKYLRPGKVAVQKVSAPSRHAMLACQATMSMTPDQPLDVASMQRLDEEWLRLGLSYLPAELNTQTASPDSQGNITIPPSGAVIHAGGAANLDEIWLQLGLTFVDDPVINDVTVLPPAPAPIEAAAAPAVLEEAKSNTEAAEVAADVDPSTFFADDLRPIVLFDGACNFCSKWTIFLLDNDPLGNLRFASMQSEAGKALLMRAGMKPSNTSEIVLAAHNKSFIGTNAILQIFSRLAMPFPLLAALGSITPAGVRTTVYKFVSNNRHKFGPQACRLFDPRFNQRFVA